MMAEGEGDVAGPLFEGVVVAFIPSDSLDEEVVEQVWNCPNRCTRANRWIAFIAHITMTNMQLT